MNKSLFKQGFTRYQADSYMYTKTVNTNWMYIVVYLDDLMLAPKYNHAVPELSRKLNEQFQNKDRAQVTYYFRI